MIIHCVFCDFRDDVDTAVQDEIFSELATFSQNLDGVESFVHGPNLDFEMKSPNYDSGFVIRFRDQHALNNYAVHPTHQELGARLCDLCNGGANGIIVFDLDTAGPKEDQ